ncbi:MAG: patatin-like phospholipase family protein [Rectinema sp.]
MELERENYCLVLGGGGAKGVYHIGVWRALRELGIQVDAFIGASIGAIIAGFLAQGSDEALEEIGRTITVENILALPEELTRNGEVKLDRDSLAGAREFFSSLLGKRGLDTDPMRRLLSGRIDEKTIRNSGKDLGVVAVNLSDLVAREVFVEDMEPGTIIDYLMASATFPGFERTEIEGKKYLDGGIYDNVPYAMARKRGYRHIIVSDISGMGRAKKPQIDGTVTIYIKNSIDMGSVLDFNREFLDSFLFLGYLDTMRTFGRFIGYSYFVEPDSAAEKAFIPHPSVAASEFPDYMRHDRRKLLLSLECAASALGVERIRAYSYESLAAAIEFRKMAVESKIAETEARSGLRTLAPALREAVTKRRFDECPYYYYRLIGDAFQKTPGSLLRKALVGFYPELPAAAAWIG